MSLLNDITALDFETTGYSPKRGRVIEIGAIRCIQGKIVSQFQTLVKFEGKLSGKITAITGIRQQDLEAGMDEKTAFAILRNLIGNSLIVAHNAPFDLGFLHEAYGRLSTQTVLNNNFLDTLSVCRTRHPSPRSLGDMCRAYHIPLLRPHRALEDASACLELFFKLHEESPADDFINKVVINPKYGIPKWLPPNAVLATYTSQTAS